MSVEDFLALSKLYPDIGSKDPIESSKALDRFFNSPLSEPYRVARRAAQVQRSPRPPIIVKRAW
jgi:hypothetical protein